MKQTLVFKEESCGLWDEIFDDEILSDLLNKAIFRRTISEEKKKCGIRCYNCGDIMINKEGYCLCLLCNTISKY